jgi:hypothetical protein
MQISEEEQVSVRQPLVRIQAATDQLVCPSSLQLSGAVLRSQIKLRTGILVDIEVIRSRLRRQRRSRVERRTMAPARAPRQGVRQHHAGYEPRS